MTEVAKTAMLGGIVVACLVAAVQFLKFWRLSRDRFFVWFAMAFALFGASFAIRALTRDASEQALYLYGPRLLGFLLILFAILDKNRRTKE